jgi:hypothetical protein
LRLGTPRSVERHSRDLTCLSDYLDFCSDEKESMRDPTGSVLGAKHGRGDDQEEEFVPIAPPQRRLTASDFSPSPPRAVRCGAVRCGENTVPRCGAVNPMEAI